MLFNIKPLKSTDEVRGEIRKIVVRQKKGGADDLSAFQGEIEELLSLLEFKPEWKKQPVVARSARIEGAETAGKITPYSQDVLLPDTKHDLGLVTKMLNYMRGQKQLPAVKQPLFVQPDEISLARKEGKINFEGGRIVSQVSVVLQKGAIMYVGFVFGRNYVILQN
ncbi:MAG TPA: hypothetical protein VFS46_00045 [Nitrososphaera sp.]|nr:hypothetical protein [Nitrososphaera sp.]